MGFTSNWMLVRGQSPEQIWARLDVRPNGERTDHPKGWLVGAALPNGAYLLVEDSAEEPIEETWDLAMLSTGGEVIGVGEVDGAGGAELVVWRDGHKQWGIAADDGELEVWGEVPASILTAVEVRARPDDEDDEDADYFTGILDIGAELTGYECGSGIAGTAPFEILDTAGDAVVLA